MRAAVDVPVTVKLRIGVVDARELGRRGNVAAGVGARRGGALRDARAAGARGIRRGIVAAGCDAIIVHARKAVLGAWSPRDNREIPPLRYDVVRGLKERIDPAPVVVNGGLRTAEQVVSELDWADGVMLGREAYHRPMLLAELSAAGAEPPSRLQMLERMTAVRAPRNGARRTAVAGSRATCWGCMPGCRAPRSSAAGSRKEPVIRKPAAELLLEAGRACEGLSGAAA